MNADMKTELEFVAFISFPRLLNCFLSALICVNPRLIPSFISASCVQVLNRILKDAAAVLETFEHIKAGARRREQDHVT